MQCMKCGQDVEETGVFCNACLADMKNYPVRPGTVVQLPKYQEYYPRRQMPKRKPAPTLEEQLNKVRKWCRVLAGALAASILLLAVTGYLLFRKYTEEEKLLPAQNYSAATTADGEPGEP